jgi:hypothetical protein
MVIALPHIRSYRGIPVVVMKSFAKAKKLKLNPLMSWTSFTGKCMSAFFPRKPRSMLRML